MELISSQDRELVASPLNTPYRVTKRVAMSKTTRTAKRFLSLASRTDCLKMLLSGMMSEHSMVQSGVEEWILSLEDFPVNLSLWLDNGKGMPTKEICGPIPSESLAKYDPDTHSLRTSQVLLALDTLKPSSVTLPKSGMIVNGTLYLRPLLEHHTLENDSGCWRTPSQSDGEGGMMRMGEGDGKYKLRDQVQEVNRQFWPTPSTRDYKDTGDSIVKGTVPVNSLLGRAVQPTKMKGSLDPAFVEYLMGFPSGWSDLKCLGMRGFQWWLEGFLK